MAEIPALIATVSGTTSNTYGTEAECLAYMRIRPGGQEWLDKDPADRRGSLLFATILIEREVFWGLKEDSAQALQFPRVPGTSGVIPTAIKHAQFEQALDLVTGDYADRVSFVDTQELGVREMRNERTTVRMVPASNSGALPAWKLSTTARSLIAPYMDATLMVARA